jgi:predicted DCC family thiol-disulfide oxidoreductase YuxK
MNISVITEITDNASAASGPPDCGDDTTPQVGWVLYDGECEFCRGIVRLIRGILAPRGFAFLPLQTPWVRAVFDLPERELLSEMRVLLRSGEKFGGADAIPVLASTIWWAWPIVLLARIPGARRLLGSAYRYVAARRYCIAGACDIPGKWPRRNP